MSEAKTEKPVRALVEDVFKLAEKIAREELESEYTVKCQVEHIEVTSDNEVNARAVFYYVTKLMEISESVSEGISDLREEVSEEELEEEWEKRYNEVLEEVNSMYAVNAIGDLRVQVLGSGVLHISVDPKYCGGDYCEVGLEITVELLQLPLEILSANPEYTADLVARAVVYVVNLATL
jgi:uncharacterized protein (DUF433 family)